ncbi:unnamed protein product [Prunus armeniaca]
MPQISPDCLFCQSHSETIHHLFIECCFARDVWACSHDLQPLRERSGSMHTWLLSLSLYSPKSELDLISKALLICWQIWEARNNLLFQDSKPLPANCIHDAATVGWKLNSWLKKDKDFSMMIKWHPPSYWLD